MPGPVVQATGRRKSSVARVRFYEGTGKFFLNGRSLEDYYPQLALRLRVLEPLKTSDMEGRYDVHARLEGGGYTGQSDALRLGIARALVGIAPDLRPQLKVQGMLTRDSRKVERKKPGQPKARKRFQFSKR